MTAWHDGLPGTTESPEGCTVELADREGIRVVDLANSHGFTEGAASVCSFIDFQIWCLAIKAGAWAVTRGRPRERICYKQSCIIGRISGTQPWQWSWRNGRHALHATACFRDDTTQLIKFVCRDGIHWAI